MDQKLKINLEWLMIGKHLFNLYKSFRLQLLTQSLYLATFTFPVFYIIFFYVTHGPFRPGILVYACHENKIFIHSFIYTVSRHEKLHVKTTGHTRPVFMVGYYKRYPLALIYIVGLGMGLT